MIMRNLFYIFSLCCLISSSLFAFETSEDINRPILSQYSASPPLHSLSPRPLTSQENLEPKKNFPFVSIGVLSPFISRGGFPLMIPLAGAGLSIRQNHVMTDISLRSLAVVNSLSYAKSKIIYKDSSNRGMYFSYGLGGYLGNIGLLPIAGVIVPCHVGYEGKNGFIDLGAEINGLYIFEPLLMPEIRAGLKF